MKSTLNVSIQVIQTITALCLACTTLWATSITARAAPVGQYEGFVNSPRANAVVRGVVSIDGTANHPEFQKYEVRLTAGLNPNVPDGQWIRLNISESAVVNGQLAVWDTTAVPDGAYILRLRVVRLDSNYQDFDIAPINVANAVPPTPTPVPPSPTPAITPTPPPPTPSPTPAATVTSFVPGATVTPFNTPTSGTPGSTPAPGETPPSVATLAPSGTLPPTDSASPTPILIDQPTIVVATSTPDPDAVAVVPAPTRDSGGDDDNPFGIPGLPEELPSIEAQTFTEPLVYGIVGTAGVFLVIGVLYIVRAIFRAVRR